MKLTVPADPQYVSYARSAVGKVLEQVKMEPAAAEDMLLAVGEACNNAVLYTASHAGQSLSIICRALKSTPRTNAAMQVDIRNRGNGFTHKIDPSSFDMPAAELMGDHGRGLPLMNMLVDDVQFLNEGGDTLVRLTKSL